ncbi:MAG TPA: TadE/TadG family type IV pilus assembly protein [Acidimicrobiales bacterium]|nr:TadE/TadG family type IV pilus assembly protein [Acidimicrobiales bacterium]
MNNGVIIAASTSAAPRVPRARLVRFIPVPFGLPNGKRELIKRNWDLGPSRPTQSGVHQRLRSGRSRPIKGLVTIRRRGSRGSAIVEFALCLPFLVIMTLGTIDGARLYATWNRTKHAAQVGADFAQYYPLRQAAAGSSCAAPNNITSRVQNEGTDLTVSVSPVASPLCQDMTGASAVQPGQTVAVTVTAPFTFITPFAKALWGNPVVKATARITVQG